MFYIKCVFNLLFWVSGVSLPCGNWSFPVWENFLVGFPPIYFLFSFFQKLPFLVWYRTSWIESLVFCVFLFLLFSAFIFSILLSWTFPPVYFLTILFVFYSIGFFFLVSKHSYCLFHEWLSWLFFLGNINSHYFEVLFCFLLYFKFF